MYTVKVSERQFVTYFIITLVMVIGITVFTMKYFPIFTPLFIIIPYWVLFLHKLSGNLSKFVQEIASGYMFLIAVMFLCTYSRFEIAFGKFFISGFKVKQMLMDHETERGVFRAYEKVAVYPSETLHEIFSYLSWGIIGLSFFLCYKAITMKPHKE